MNDLTGKTLEEKQLNKGKKSIMSVFPQFLAVLICTIIAIVILSNKNAWLDKICESLAKSMLESAMQSGSLSTLASIEQSVKTTRNALNTVFSIVSTALIVFSVIPFLIQCLRLACTQLSLTNKRVVGKTGITHVRKTDTKIEDIFNIEITSTFWGRIFKYDNIEIKGSKDVYSVIYKGISNAEDIKNAINSMIEQRKKEYYERQKSQTDN